MGKIGEKEYRSVERYCKQCGKYMFIRYPEEYVFTRESWEGNQQRKLWFCGWNCMRSFDKEREVKAQQERAAKKAEAKKKKVKQSDGIKPVTETKTRYTIHRCGVCGKQVAMTAKTCRHCKTLINWSQYEKE